MALPAPPPEPERCKSVYGKQVESRRGLVTLTCHQTLENHGNFHVAYYLPPPSAPAHVYQMAQAWDDSGFYPTREDE